MSQDFEKEYDDYQKRVRQYSINIVFGVCACAFSLVTLFIFPQFIKFLDIVWIAYILHFVYCLYIVGVKL